jgi:3-oxoacyl-[acyl-carrier protein] reductase
MQTILITGTRKGIGKEMAEHFLQSGWSVAGCSRGEPTIQHDHYKHFLLDARDEKRVVEMVRAVSSQCGAIDALLNNAGLASMNHILTTPGKTLHSLFETNVFGSFYFMREVGKIMARQKSGRIVNFTTVAVPIRLAGEAAYAASKSAIEMLTRVGAKELANYNITVNAIGPTPVATDLIKAVPEAKIQQLLSHQAIPRLGRYEDIINVVDFFLDKKSDFITGQVIYLGGQG